MDATFRPHSVSPKLFAYAENKKIFEIFQTILESLAVDRPSKPLEYLYDLLIKGGVYNKAKVYILGPRSPDRTLICSSLSLKLGVMHLTRTSLLEFDDLAKVPSPADWANMVKNRVSMPDCLRNGWILEDFPRTRTDAFLLRKLGVFPTHIALIEPSDLTVRSRYQTDEETRIYLGQKSLILDLHRNSYVKTFTVDSDVDTSVTKVVEFVRSKKNPRMPYLPRVLLLGSYGSGRRTVAKKVSERYHLIRVDFQEELRKAAIKDSLFKELIQELVKKKSPVPDTLLAKIASTRLLEKDCIENGWVMYNFPETFEQAKLLVNELEGFQVNRCVFLDSVLETCLERVGPRLLDPMTGIFYHLEEKIEEEIKVRLKQFPQDSVQRVEAEYKRYTENVEELKAFFRLEMTDDITVEVNAEEPEENVFESVQEAILKSSKIKLLE